MKNKALFITHYASISGTTHYVLESLKSVMDVYLIKHPLNESDHFSVLELHSNHETIVLKKYSVSNNFIIRTLQAIALNVFISYKLIVTKKIKNIVSFGSVNTYGLGFVKLFKTKLIFWGVDYSVKRFNNVILNRFYYFLETHSCRISDQVINTTKMQERARIKNHRLKSKKSTIIENGVVPDLKPMKPKNGNKPALLYIGSLSTTHGLIKFVKNNSSIFNDLEIYIFGSGSSANTSELKKISVDNGNIKYFGAATVASIKIKMQKSKKNFVGIAPYNNNDLSHVKFGDSLKIKEYINLGLPFISSNAVNINRSLIKYGAVYSNQKELDTLLSSINTLAKIEISSIFLHKRFSWNNLVHKKLLPILEHYND